MADRDYQVTARDSIIADFDAGIRRLLCVMPTGTGKTYVAGLTCLEMARRGMRTLFVAPKVGLVNQTYDELRGMGLDVAIEMGGVKARDHFGMPPNVTVATVQSMQGERLDSWPSDTFGLVINDECHRAADYSHGAVRSHFGGSLELGLTATPDGISGRIGAVYQKKTFEYPLLKAVDEAYLVPFKRQLCKVPIDLRGLRMDNGDYNPTDIAERISSRVEFLADGIKQYVGDRQFAVFAPTVASARQIAQALCSATGSGPGLNAHYVAGPGGEWGQSRTMSTAITKNFNDGNLQVIVSCEMLFEGWDSKRVAGIANCRATTLRYRYYQTIGRGLRPVYEQGYDLTTLEGRRASIEASGKKYCLVLDFDWMADGRSRDIITSVEFISSYDEELAAMSPDDRRSITERARQMIDRGETDDPREAIERAKTESYQKGHLPLFMSGTRAIFDIEILDPFDAARACGVKLKRSTSEVGHGHPAATPAQVYRLKQEGVAHADNLTLYGASKLMTEVKKREKDGLATIAQVAKLQTAGVGVQTARAMTATQASETLETLKVSSK